MEKWLEKLKKKKKNYGLFGMDFRYIYMEIFDEKDQGPISSIILNLCNLNKFLTSNQLTGRIPDSLGQFSHLAYLTI